LEKRERGRRFVARRGDVLVTAHARDAVDEACMLMVAAIV